MSLPDSALSQPVVEAVMLAFLDIAGDPIRAALAPFSISVPAGFVGDGDIDGHVFSAIDPTFLDVSAVTHGDGGTETVTFSLSATIASDSDLLNQLGDPANFRGRVAKLWIGLRSGATITHLRPHYVGYMAVPDIDGDPDGQTISLAAENYLNILSGGPPARTLLSQPLYDAGDHSGEATAGGANGTSVLGAAGAAVAYPNLDRLRS